MKGFMKLLAWTIAYDKAPSKNTIGDGGSTAL